jgi:Ketopantoate hydroxymethyltransferase
MAHLGLTPQSIYQFGTYTVRAKEEAEAEKLLADARAVQEAGAFSVVLEKIPAGLAKKVTESLDIPTIGIGAGVECDGQVLVLHDMLGLNKGFKPRFLRRYGELGQLANDAIAQYVTDVRAKTFPSKDESYE